MKKERLSCRVPLKPLSKHTRKHKRFANTLVKRFAPVHMKPQDDFYHFINHQWLKGVLQVGVDRAHGYLTQIDNFRLTQHAVFEQLHTIIQECIQSQTSTGRNMERFYTSVIRMNPIRDSCRLASEAMAWVDHCIQSNQPWHLLGTLLADEMVAFRCPLVWSVRADEQEVNKNICYILPHQFALMDLDVYYDDGTQELYKKRYRRAFAQSNQQMFRALLGSAAHGLQGTHVFQVEQQLFEALGCNQIDNASSSTYHKVLLEDAIAQYGFRWDILSRELGFDQPPASFVTNSLNYLSCGTRVFLESWNTPPWRTYWIWILCSRLCRITRRLEHLNYDFHGAFERGQLHINQSDSVSAALYLSVPFNAYLTRVYQTKYKDTAVLQYVETLSEDLRQVFLDILRDNTWMASSTKAAALAKLKQLKFVYGVPTSVPRDPPLQYVRDSLYSNLALLHAWKHRQRIDSVGQKPVNAPEMDWAQYPVKMSGNQCYIVNASYTPTSNTVYLNLGYLQKPFVDLDERGIEYNLAHVGFTVAHELSHALDDWGSQYGADGNLSNWWTKADTHYFRRLQRDIVRHYETFAQRDGITFDATLGLGEDLADIAGLSICEEYLRRFQEQHQDTVPIQQLSFQAFYTYFAIQQRQYVGPLASQAQLKTNPHPLDQYRCNIPLSRSKIFRALYHVQRQDGMWWHSTESIW